MDINEYKFRNLPLETVDQLERLCDCLQETLTMLTGVILHGSAATSGFEVGRSDVDILVIVDLEEDEAREELTLFGSQLPLISTPSSPLELSIVSAKDLLNWQHPCRHLLHYSEELRERYESGLILPRAQTDVDLAMHITVARARGIDLLGTFPAKNLPEVPEYDFLGAVLDDFEWARLQGPDHEQYLLANACRTLAYLAQGVVLSKTEGVDWCNQRGVDLESVVINVEDKLRRVLR